MSSQSWCFASQHAHDFCVETPTSTLVPQSAQELLPTLPNERLDQLASVAARYHPPPTEEPMTIRDALLHAVEHCALHQGHLELTRQLLGYAPAGAQ